MGLTFASLVDPVWRPPRLSARKGSSAYSATGDMLPGMGIVYILTNEAMPGLIKIGITSNELEQRMLSLDNTSVPLPFECYYAGEVADAPRVEKAMHTAFGDHRVRSSREFFALDAFRAKAFLEVIALCEVTPFGVVVATVEDADAIERTRKRRPPFQFSMVGIPVGSVLISARDPEQTAIVVDDKNIQFRGERMSLSAAASIIEVEEGRRDGVAGTGYWLYENQTLWEFRNEVEGWEGGDE